VEKKAAEGDSSIYSLPIAKLDEKYSFSFSGLKTAVLRLAQTETGHDHTFPSYDLPGALSEAQKADIAAAFQYTAVRTIVDKAILAQEEFSPASIVIAGGVAASPELRRQLAEAFPGSLEYPDMKLCTDNGAMVATLGCFKVLFDQPTADPYTLPIAPNLSM
jgi:N6-L-threonylcarbamoyladenine synthase